MSGKAPAGDLPRCTWPGIEDPLYARYHDTEWGVPKLDGAALFEKLVLEGFQAGLSWLTILRKREAFRSAFAGFDAQTIARWGPPDVERLMADPGIVRNRAKIEATITNARAYLDLEAREPFAWFCWQFVDFKPVSNCYEAHADVPAQTAASKTRSKALKANGVRFVGPTTLYAFMQSVGMVNDHLVTCHRHAPCALALARIDRDAVFNAGSARATAGAGRAAGRAPRCGRGAA